MNDRYGPPPASEDAISNLAERTLADGDDVIGKDCHVCMDEFKVRKPRGTVYELFRAQHLVVPTALQHSSTAVLQYYSTHAACRPVMT
jgi:hypothetical protein